MDFGCMLVRFPLTGKWLKMYDRRRQIFTFSPRGFWLFHWAGSGQLSPPLQSIMGVSEHHCKLVLAVSQASKAFHHSHWLTNGQLQAFWFSFRFMCSFDINLIKPNLVLKQDEIKVICFKLKNCKRYRKWNYAFCKKKICFCKILSVFISSLLKIGK